MTNNIRLLQHLAFTPIKTGLVFIRQLTYGCLQMGGALGKEGSS